MDRYEEDLAKQATRFWGGSRWRYWHRFLAGGRRFWFFPLLRAVIPSFLWPIHEEYPMTHSEVHKHDGRFAQSRRIYESKIPHLFDLAGKKLTSGLKVLDWGSGGGALYAAMGKHIAIAYGVDVSPSILFTAAGTARRYGVNFEKVLYRFAANIHEQLDSRIPGRESFDLFAAHWVYMHFPSKRIGEAVTEYAFHHLKPGGLAMINFASCFPEDMMDKRKALKLRYGERLKYEHIVLRATLWQVNEFRKMAGECGFKILACEKKQADFMPSDNYTYYAYLKKP